MNILSLVVHGQKEIPELGILSRNSETPEGAMHHTAVLGESSKSALLSSSQNMLYISPGMGWFWDAEVAFGCLPGVILTAVGYAGGSTEGPSYYKYFDYSSRHQLVGHPRMGDHTECIRVTYDPEKIKYQDILNVFWRSHDSTAKSSRSVSNC